MQREPQRLQNDVFHGKQRLLPLRVHPTSHRHGPDAPQHILLLLVGQGGGLDRLAIGGAVGIFLNVVADAQPPPSVQVRERQYDGADRPGFLLQLSGQQRAREGHAPHAVLLQGHAMVRPMEQRAGGGVGRGGEAQQRRGVEEEGRAVEAVQPLRGGVGGAVARGGGGSTGCGRGSDTFDAGGEGGVNGFVHNEFGSAGGRVGGLGAGRRRHGGWWWRGARRRPERGAKGREFGIITIVQAWIYSVEIIELPPPVQIIVY